MQDGILPLSAPYMETRFHNAGRHWNDTYS